MRAYLIVIVDALRSGARKHRTASYVAVADTRIDAAHSVITEYAQAPGCAVWVGELAGPVKLTSQLVSVSELALWLDAQPVPDGLNGLSLVEVQS